MLCCLIAALGGGLHGYTNGVTGGISANEHFLQEFYVEALLQPPTSPNIFCSGGSQRLQLYTSIHFIAAAIFEGTGMPAHITRTVGRSSALAAGGCMFAMGSLLQTASVNIGMLLLGRVVAGLGLSVTTVSSLLYLGETAPAESRGRMLSLFQTHLSGFILLASLVDLALGHTSFGWRISCALPVVVGMVLATVSLAYLPESPVSLMERGHLGAASQALVKLRTPHDHQQELIRLQAHAELSRCCLKPWAFMFSKACRPQLILSGLCTILQQLTGINFLVFYGSQLFSNLGFSPTLALSISAAIDAALFLGSLIAVVAVDRWGRRFLFLTGSGISALSMLLIAIVLTLAPTQVSTVAQTAPWLPWVVLVLACIFMLSYGWSFGPLGWTYPVEIQHVQTRSVGLSVTSFFNVLLSAVAAQSILAVTCHLREGVFYFFAVMCAVGLVLVWWLFPETNQANIEAGGSHLCERPPWTHVNDD